MSVNTSSLSHEVNMLTFLVLSNDWVAEFNELSSSNLVDGLDSEVVLAIGDEVFDGPAHLVLSRHHVDICPPASLTPLQAHRNKINLQSKCVFESLMSDSKQSL